MRLISRCLYGLLIIIEHGRLIRDNSLVRLFLSERLSFLPSPAQSPGDELHAPQAVIVGRDWIGDPRRIGVGVDDPDRWDVVQRAFVQQHPILHRVQANHQVRFQRRSVFQFTLQLPNHLIELVESNRRARGQELQAICESSRLPSLEDMIAAGQLGCFHHYSGLSLAGAHEQDETCPFSDAGDNAARPAEMGGCHVEGDDVDTLADAKYVARVSRVPERGRVAQMGLGGEKMFERNL